MTDDAAASQAWSAADYVRNAGFVSTLGAPLIDALDPRSDERVLDLGCGDGELAETAIAGRGATVSGIDASASMIDAARDKGIDARVGDGPASGRLVRPPIPSTRCSPTRRCTGCRTPTRCCKACGGC